MKGTQYMDIVRVLAVLTVNDMERAIAWYTKLLGRAFDDRPMDEAAEWHLSPGGSLQLVLNPKDAGQSMVTLGVDDIEEVIRTAADAGIALDTSMSNERPFRLAIAVDGEGNRITFAQDMRERFPAS
jgi:predicted enzyme related to lactoylglutathione lyase